MLQRLQPLHPRALRLLVLLASCCLPPALTESCSEVTRGGHSRSLLQDSTTATQTVGPYQQPTETPVHMEASQTAIAFSIPPFVFRLTPPPTDSTPPQPTSVPDTTPQPQGVPPLSSTLPTPTPILPPTPTNPPSTNPQTAQPQTAPSDPGTTLLPGEANPGGGEGGDIEPTPLEPQIPGTISSAVPIETQPPGVTQVPTETSTDSTTANPAAGLLAPVAGPAINVVGVPARVEILEPNVPQAPQTPPPQFVPEVTLPPYEDDDTLPLSGTWEGYIALWPLHTADQILHPEDEALGHCFRLYFYPVHDDLEVYEVVNSTGNLWCSSQDPQLLQLNSNDHAYITGTLHNGLISIASLDSIFVMNQVLGSIGSDLSGAQGAGISIQSVNNNGPILGAYKLLVILARLPNYPGPPPVQCISPTGTNLTESGVTIDEMRAVVSSVNTTWSSCSYGKLSIDNDALLIVDGIMTGCTSSSGAPAACNQWTYSLPTDGNWLERQRLAILDNLVEEYGSEILKYDGHLVVWPFQGRCAFGNPPRGMWFGNAMFKCRYVTDGPSVPGQGKRACVSAYNGWFGADNFTVVHEMGHMLGLQHGRTFTPTTDSSTYPFNDYADRTTSMGNMGFPSPGFPVVAPNNANSVIAGTGHAQCYSLPQLYLLQWNALTELNNATLPYGIPARINITSTLRAEQAGLIIRTDWLPQGGCKNLYNGAPVNCDNVFVNYLLNEKTDWQDALDEQLSRKSSLYRYGASWETADQLVPGQAGRFLYEAWWADALADDETYFLGDDYKLAITQRVNDPVTGLAEIEVCRYRQRPADCMSVTWFATFFEQTGLVGNNASARSIWPIFTTLPGSSDCSQPAPSFNTNPLMTAGASRSFVLQLWCQGYRCSKANSQWALQFRSRPVPDDYPSDQDLAAVVANLTSSSMTTASCPNEAYCEYRINDFATIPGLTGTVQSFTLCITPSGMKNTLPLYRNHSVLPTPLPTGPP